MIIITMTFIDSDDDNTGEGDADFGNYCVS